MTIDLYTGIGNKAGARRGSYSAIKIFDHLPCNDWGFNISSGGFGDGALYSISINLSGRTMIDLIVYDDHEMYSEIARFRRKQVPSILEIEEMRDKLIQFSFELIFSLPNGILLLKSCFDERFNNGVDAGKDEIRRGLHKLLGIE